MSPSDKSRPRKPRPPATSPQPKAWDIPPLPKRGDRHRDDTFVGVGRALSQWEHFEGEIGLIYGVLVRSFRETSPAIRAYGSVAAFSTRIEMINEASKAFFLHVIPSIEKEIKHLLDDAKQFATRRNEIAHGIVQPYYSKGSTQSGYVLGPSRFATRKQKLSRDGGWGDIEVVYAYTSRELDDFSTHFGTLTERAMEIYLATYRIYEGLQQRTSLPSPRNETDSHRSSSQKT